MDSVNVFVTSGASDDLIERFERIVRRLIREEVTRAVQQGMMKPYLTTKELKDLTGWSDRQISYKKSRREIPYIRRGRLVLFPSKEVIDFLEAGRVPVRKPRCEKPKSAGSTTSFGPSQQDEP